MIYGLWEATRLRLPQEEPRWQREDASPAEARGREGILGVLEFVRDQWKADRWYAVLLGLVALNAVLAFLGGNVSGLIVSAVVLWGLLTYNYWVYIIMLVAVGLSVLQGGLLLITGQLSLGALPGLAVSAFILGVLAERYDHYT